MSKPKQAPIRVGCAGWSIPRGEAAAFPPQGSHLQRYAERFNCVEINSSFYRPHRPSTYARWAASVPDAFRFSVKMPRTITHYARLVGVSAQLDAFFHEASALGDKLGCILVQLPPSLKFELAIARRFLTMLRRRHDGMIAIEPRHPTWFTTASEALLHELRVARVAADPAVVPMAAIPGGDALTRYFRLHGSPKIYYSTYDKTYLAELTVRLREGAAGGAECWCIFDNTASGAATANALEIRRRLAAGDRR